MKEKEEDMVVFWRGWSNNEKKKGVGNGKGLVWL